METYRILINIGYKGKKFKVLSNSHHQKYFLRILDDGSLIYPTFDEYLELYKIFSSNKYYDINKKDYNINSTNKVKLFPKFKKLKLEPKVILSDNRLVLLELALLTAMFVTNDSPIINPNPVELSDGVYLLDAYDRDTTICNSTLFASYLEIDRPTYEDLKELIYKKDNISEKYKEWLTEGLDNIEKELGEINLSVLYYNLSRLNIINKNYDEIHKDTGMNVSIGYFDIETGDVVVNEEMINRKTFCHEVLGHGMTEAYAKGKAYTSIRMPVITESEGYKLIYDFGISIEEAKADMIAQIACGLKIGKIDTSYNQFIEFLRICMETTGVSLNDLIQKGVPYLIEKMKENGIDDPITHIENMDALMISFVNESGVFDIQIPGEEFNYREAILWYMCDYADDKIAEGENQEKVGQEVFDIVNNSYFENVTDGKTWINMENVAKAAKFIVDSEDFKENALNNNEEIEEQER